MQEIFFVTIFAAAVTGKAVIVIAGPPQRRHRKRRRDQSNLLGQIFNRPIVLLAAFNPQILEAAQMTLTNHLLAMTPLIDSARRSLAATHFTTLLEDGT